MSTLLIALHVTVSIALIVIVLLQMGKGAEAGASFGGGASQTVFGSQGSGNFLTKTTKYLAIIFFVTSISLAVIAKQRSEVSAQQALPTASLLEKTVEGAADIEASTDLEAPKVELEASDSLESPAVKEKQTELE